MAIKSTLQKTAAFRNLRPYYSNFAAGLCSDPNTVFLLRLDGEIADVSRNGLAITACNGAAFSTSVVHDGSGSLYIPAAGYLSVPAADCLDMGAGNWTADWWGYPSSVAAFPSYICNQAGWVSGSYGFRHNTDGYVRLYWNGLGDPYLVSTASFALNAWHHYAVVRSGSNIYLYVDGAKQATGACAADWTHNFASGGVAMIIGFSWWDGASGYFTGYMDNIRISNIARWTEASFTVPNGAF